MFSKFRFAPGCPGYGSKGKDGSAGLQGFSMYFTDYDPATEITTINVAIQNNYVLWSITPTTALPSNRVYITGDLFVDSDGKIYEINAETNTFQYKFANLNIAGYFVSADVSSDVYSFNRYYNSNTSPKYIIDNIYADGAIAYYEIPSEIYNVVPRNFARIEYSNINENGYNPFTLFSSGETTPTDDAKSLAIVREIGSNTFRIGNLDNTGTIRNVNLTFDVSSLKHTKQAISYFNLGTPDGEILTNYEINANALFNPVFHTSPATFTAGYGTSDVSISWRLTGFTPDTDVNADLYFYQDASTSGTISMANDASTYRPLIFYNCVSSGTINITDLAQTTTYKYYMNIYKNGWERRSTIKSITTGAIPYIILIPTSTTEVSVGHTVGFCVSSNVAWSAAFYLNPGSFMSNLTTPVTTGGTSDASLTIDISNNYTYSSKTGQFKVSALTGGGNSPVTGIILQNGLPPIVEFGYTNITTDHFYADIDGQRYITKTATLYQNNLPTYSGVIDISVYVIISWINNSPNDDLEWTYNLTTTDGSTLLSISDWTDPGFDIGSKEYVRTYYGYDASDTYLLFYSRLDVDWNSAPTASWHIKSSVEAVPIYRTGGDPITSLDLSTRIMCAQIPTDNPISCIAYH